MFQTLIGALGAFVGLSVGGAAGRKYYDDGVSDEMVGVFVVNCLYVMLLSSLVVMFVAYIFRWDLSEWLGLPVKWIMLSVLASSCLFVIRLRLIQWQVRRQPIRYGAMQIGNSLLDFVASLVLVVVWSLGAAGRMSAHMWAVAIVAFLALLSLYNSGFFKVYRFNFGCFKEALKYGVPLIPHVGGIFLLASVDRFVINSMLGVGDVGVYMVAVQVAAGMAIVSDAVNKAFVPWLYDNLKKNDAESNRKVVSFTYVWFFIVCVGACALWVGGPSVVLFVAGPEYQNAAELVGWLALGQAFSGMYLMVTNYVLYSKRTGWLSLATICSGFVNLVLLLVLVPLYGLTGAALAFSAAMAVRFLSVWAVAQKTHPMPWFGKV